MDTSSLGNEVNAYGFIHGIILSIAASIIGGVSKLCLRKSYILEKDRIPTLISYDESGFMKYKRIQIQAYCLRGSGVIGMSILNPFCGAWAMKFASPSILAPFSGLTLVWIVLFSEQTIGERPTSIQIIAVSMVVIGQIIIAIFGDHTNIDSLTLNELRAQYSDPSFLAFFVAMAIWFLLITILIYSGTPNWRRFAWGVSGGCVTGFMCFVKDALALTDGYTGNEYPYDWYILWACALIFPAFGLMLLMACIKRYDVTYSSSMFVVGLVCTTSIMSAVHYHTLEHLKYCFNFIMYFIGIFVLIFGAILLATEIYMKGNSWKEYFQVRKESIKNTEVVRVDLVSINDKSAPLKKFTTKISYTSV